MSTEIIYGKNKWKSHVVGENIGFLYTEQSNFYWMFIHAKNLKNKTKFVPVFSDKITGGCSFLCFRCLSYFHFLTMCYLLQSGIRDERPRCFFKGPVTSFPPILFKVLGYRYSETAGSWSQADWMTQWVQRFPIGDVWLSLLNPSFFPSSTGLIESVSDATLCANIGGHHGGWNADIPTGHTHTLGVLSPAVKWR